MMKLVDMRGLKPRPFWGPGSTPGIGINPSFYSFLYPNFLKNSDKERNKKKGLYLYLESNQDPKRDEVLSLACLPISSYRH